MIMDPKLIAEGTVAAAMAQVLGADGGWEAVPSARVLVQDIARLHVESSNPNTEGNQSFFAVSEGERGTRWEEAIEIVNRNLTEAVKEDILPNNGPAATKRTKVDASQMEKVIGFKFQSYEEQVKSVVKQCLWASWTGCCWIAVGKAIRLDLITYKWKASKDTCATAEMIPA